uniref:Nck-associated protein 5 C-terminal domain-containing protein n=1 Tax=Salarias fasciatus TaxID=181472 RepID=A0A672HWB9_SALFA
RKRKARLAEEASLRRGAGALKWKLIHELEEERRLRLESEKRLREVSEESELGRAQMLSLQQQFSRMEETVRSLLQNQGVLEQSAVDTVDLMKSDLHANQSRDLSVCWRERRSRLADLSAEEAAVVGFFFLQERNSALALENESQREQYERCLDEVANQVVQALLTQKDLREECLKLRTRVFDLEQQNRALSVLFQQKIKPASDLLLQVTQTPPCGRSEVNGKLGFPAVKCLSQLSLAAPPPPPSYPRSSCSSSELSLSSACSDFSSGSYTWNDGRSCGKLVTPQHTHTHTHTHTHCLCSGCQTRTLDSGIGTFPLHDPAGRAGGRHPPKSESGPEGVTAAEPPASRLPDPSQPLPKVPSPSKSRPQAPGSLAHSLSDPAVTPARPAPSGESAASRPQSIFLQTGGCGSVTDELFTSGTGSAACSPRRTPLHRAGAGEAGQRPAAALLRGAPSWPHVAPLRDGVCSSAGRRDEDTLTRSLSILDLYGRDAPSPLEDGGRIPPRPPLAVSLRPRASTLAARSRR